MQTDAGCSILNILNTSWRAWCLLLPTAGATGTQIALNISPRLNEKFLLPSGRGQLPCHLASSWPQQKPGASGGVKLTPERFLLMLGAEPGSSKKTPHTSHGLQEAWRHLSAQVQFSLPQDTANICTFPVPVAKKNQSAPMLPFVPINTVCLFIPGEQDPLIYVNWDCTGRFFPSTSPCIPLRNQTDFIISYSSQQPAGTPASACKACWQAAFFFSPPHEEFCAFWQFWRLTELWLQFSYVIYIYMHT